MAPHPGNKHALKLNTPELRAEAYRQYCDHIAQGWQKKSWYFDHPEITCSWSTIEKTILDYANEFDLEHMIIAESKSLKHWETVLYASAKGENKDANTASMQMIFRNKFGWDKSSSHQHEDATLAAVENTQQVIFRQLEQFQSQAKSLVIEAEGVAVNVD